MLFGTPVRFSSVYLLKLYTIAQKYYQDCIAMSAISFKIKESCLGEGSFGKVDIVSTKIMREDGSIQIGFLARKRFCNYNSFTFERDLNILITTRANQKGYKNICRLLYSEDATKDLFFELIEGKSLDSYAQDIFAINSSYSANFILFLMGKVASTLKQLHSIGISTAMSKVKI